MNLSSHKISPWLPWFFASLFYAFQFALRVAPSVMTEELMQAFNVTPYTLGLLISVYYYGYAAFQIPAGALVDRFGVRVITTLAILCCIIGCLLFTYTTAFFLIAMGRLLIGIGSAFSFLICLKVVTVWFSPQKLPTLVGISIFIGTVGAIGGASPVALSVAHMGWRSTMLVMILIACALLLCAFFLVRDKKNTSTNEPRMGIMAGIKNVISNPQSLLIGLYAALAYVPLSAFCDLWGVPFLETSFGVPASESGFLVSIVYLGLGLGSTTLGAIAKFFGSYRRPLILSSLLTVCLFAIIITRSEFSALTFGVLFFLLGLALSPQMLSFTLAVDLNLPSLSGTVGGVINMFSMLSGVIFQPLIGKILSLLSQESAMTGGHFQIALSIIPLMTLFSIFIPFFIKETYQKNA
jgi:predicted MFS family arabinose efflux permease